MIYVGKGPSAVHAVAAIRERGDLVATVNDAGSLFDGGIDFAFFADVEMLERARPLWPRMKTIVLPSRLHQHFRRSRLTARDVPGLPHDRLAIYPYHATGPTERQLRAAIAAGQIPLYCTAVAGLFWMAQAGHREFHCYGFDGGSHYAPGLGSPADPTGRIYDRYRQAMEAMARIVKEQFGAGVWFHADEGT